MNSLFISLNLWCFDTLSLNLRHLSTGILKNIYLGCAGVLLLSVLIFFNLFLRLSLVSAIFFHSSKCIFSWHFLQTVIKSSDKHSLHLSYVLWCTTNSVFFWHTLHWKLSLCFTFSLRVNHSELFKKSWYVILSLIIVSQKAALPPFPPEYGNILLSNIRGWVHGLLPCLSLWCDALVL